MASPWFRTKLLRDVDATSLAVEGTLAAGVVLLPGGTPVAAGTAALAPLVAHLASRAALTRTDRAAVVLSVVADRLHVEPGKVAAAVADDPVLLDMAVGVLGVAARTRRDEKLYVLAHLLADGLLRNTPADVVGIRAAIWDDIELSHVRALGFVGLNRPGEEGGRGWTRSELAAEMPELAEALDAVLAVLTRHGLIIDTTLGGFGGVTYETQRWGPTPLGDQVLTQLEHAKAAINSES